MATNWQTPKSKVLARCTGTHARARDMKASQRTTNPNWCPDGGVTVTAMGVCASSRSLATHAASQSNLVPAHRSVRRAFPRDDPPHALIWRLNSPHSISQGTPAAPRRERPFQLARAGSHDHIGSRDVASVVRSWLERRDEHLHAGSSAGA